MMKSGPIRPETVTFDHKPVEIIAGRGRDPFSIVRMTVPPDAGVVSHQSLDEDKLFLVLSGSLRFHVGDEFHDVGAGQQIAVAKGDIHGFVNVGTTPAVQLLVSSPARHDEMLADLSKVADPNAPGALDELCRIYNQRIIGEPRRGPAAS